MPELRYNKSSTLRRKGSIKDYPSRYKIRRNCVTGRSRALLNDCKQFRILKIQEMREEVVGQKDGEGGRNEAS